tara:strand:+ start:387 stop:596 length:210 start_codon:yes stop_codon:yes gene_type:complete
MKYYVYQDTRNFLYKALNELDIDYEILRNESHNYKFHKTHFKKLKNYFKDTWDLELELASHSVFISNLT